jgi:hypothetical protein
VAVITNGKGSRESKAAQHAVDATQIATFHLITAPQLQIAGDPDRRI